MSLEDRGVPYEAFEKLQREAERDARTIHDSITRFESTARAHRLGNQYGLSDTLTRLEALGFDITAKAGKPLAESKFLGQLRFTCLLSILYEIKDHARIKIPDSYFLVGTVDEGPAYEERGTENVWKIPNDNVCSENLLCAINPIRITSLLSSF
jgi:RNA-dependent RNA polymerase